MIWANFYKFIDALLDKEHFDSPKKRELHTELIRAETNTLRNLIKNKIKEESGIQRYPLAYSIIH